MEEGEKIAKSKCVGLEPNPQVAKYPLTDRQIMSHTVQDRARTAWFERRVGSNIYCVISSKPTYRGPRKNSDCAGS